MSISAYNILANTLARRNRFRIQINNVQERTTIFDNCFSVSIPERRFTEMKKRYFGLPFGVPTDHKYADSINIKFYCSQEFDEKIYFENWMNLVYNKPSGRFAYKDDYTANMLITPLTISDTFYKRIELSEIYPVNLNAMQYDFSDMNTVQIITVDLCFNDSNII